MKFAIKMQLQFYMNKAYQIMMIIKIDIMQGPLQQQRGSKQGQRSNSRQYQDFPSSKSSTSANKSTQISHTLQKSSPIQQQILQIKCQKLNPTDQAQLINFLNKIVHLSSQSLKQNKPKYITQTINIFLTKMTKLNYTSSYTIQQKIQQIRKWKPYTLEQTSYQHCCSIISYILQQVDIDNFQDVVVLFYFVMMWGLDLGDSTMLAVCWALAAVVAEGGCGNLLVKQLLGMIMERVNDMEVCSTHMLKIYSNSMIYILKFAKSGQQIQKIEHHFDNWCLIESVLTNYRTQNLFFLSQFQGLFVYLCESYVLTGSSKIWKLIHQFVELQTTQIMVKNIWNFLNSDHNLDIFTVQNLTRVQQILTLLRQKNSNKIKNLKLTPRGSWITKQLDKSTSLIFLDILLSSPRTKKHQNDQLLLRIQFDQGSVMLCSRQKYNEQIKKLTYLLVLKKSIRRTEQSLQDKQQIEINIDSCRLNIGVELAVNRMLEIWVAEGKVVEMNVSTLWKPKYVQVGVRRQDKQNQNIIDRIFTFVTVDNATYQQYQQFNPQPQKSPSEPQKSLQQLSKLKKTHSIDMSSSQPLKIDIIQQLSCNNEKQKQKVNFFNKFNSPSKLSNEGVQVCKNNQYVHLVQKFNGISKLFCYLFNAVEINVDDAVLSKFVDFVGREIRDMRGEDGFYQLAFVHGFSLCFKRSAIIIQKLIKILSNQHIPKLQKPKSTQFHQFHNNKICILQLCLKSLIHIPVAQNQKIKQIFHKTTEQLFEYSNRLQKQDMIDVMIKILTFLNVVQWGIINDYAIIFNVQNMNKIYRMHVEDKSKGSNYNFNEKIVQEKYQILQNMEGFEQGLKAIQKGILFVLKKSKVDSLVFVSIKQYLQLLLTLFSNFSLTDKQKFKQDQIYIQLSHICKVLQLQSVQLCKMKSAPEGEADKICNLLCQIYMLIPSIVVYCRFNTQKGNTSKQYQQFYQNYCSEIHCTKLKNERFIPLMSNLYNVCFKIGSFCLKDKKNGFLTYMSCCYKYIESYKDQYSWNDKFDTLSIKDQISITQLYSCCWSFLLNSLEKQSGYRFDDETILSALQKLAELCIPLYYDQVQGKKSLIQRIIGYYLSFETKIQFPMQLLANIQSEEVQKILNKQIQSTNKKPLKISQKHNCLIYLLHIANSYPKPLSLNLSIPQSQSQSQSQQQKQKQKQKQLEKEQKWYQIYSKVKNIYELLKQNREDEILSNYNSSTQINTTIQDDLKSAFGQIVKQLSLFQYCRNLKYLLDNFVEVKHDVRGMQERQVKDYFLPFLDTVLNQFRQINTTKSQQKYQVKRKKQQDPFTHNPKDKTVYFTTQQQFVFQKQKQKQKIKVPQTTPIHRQVSQKILKQNHNYFTQIYGRLSKDKNNTLMAYYKMIEKLSFQEKLYRAKCLDKYHQFQYYILDDYLSSSKIKVMLKKDIVSVIGNLITRQIPRLIEKVDSSKHSVYALQVTKNLLDLNTNPFFQLVIEQDQKSNSTTKSKKTEVIPAILITKSKIYQGKLQIDQKQIRYSQNTFIDRGYYQRLYTSQSEQRSYQQISASQKILTIEINSISYSEKKKYLQKFASLEIFEKHLSYFFVFDNQSDREKVLKKSGIDCRKNQDFQEEINQMKSRWEKGWITNFQLLVKINNLSGRSLNDVSQYYVFPWIVCKFDVEMDDQFFKHKQNFRDLSLAIGAQNPQKLSIIKTKFLNSLNQPGLKDKPYMYGSFYSNPGVVCNYLLRVNPFTMHHYELQGYRFDLYDRLFTNMQDQYQSVYNSILDNRQLVPEFYCAPQFFRNRNKYNFAHTKSENNKVDLKMRFPKWVVTQSAEEFVLKMRKVLQSDFVSSKLGSWIDLIFGYKSTIENAQKHNNLYVSQLYRDNKNRPTMQQMDLRQSQVDHKAYMIKLFGQVPKNIFGSSSLPKLQQPQIATNIYEQPAVLKQLKLCTKQKQKQNPNTPDPLVIDSKNNIIVMAKYDKIVILNTKQDINKLEFQIQQPIRSLSMMRINKELFFLVFVVTASGQLIVYSVRKNKMSGIFISRSQEYKVDLQIQLSQGCRFSQIKTINNYAIAVQQASFKLFRLTSDKKADSIKVFSHESYYLQDLNYLSIHGAPITQIETYENLGLIMSIDTNGLTNSFSLQPQLTIRATFHIKMLKSSEKITKLLIHEMGLFLLLTNFGQILLYNIYGDLIMKVRLKQKNISDIVFWDHCSSSQVLITTKKGSLYQFDLFQLVVGVDYLAGVEISLAAMVEYQKGVGRESKVLTNRFGRYWELYLISGLENIMMIECTKNMKEISEKKKILQNCNMNSTYKNV